MYDGKGNETRNVWYWVLEEEVRNEMSMENQ